MSRDRIAKIVSYGFVLLFRSAAQFRFSFNKPLQNYARRCSRRLGANPQSLLGGDTADELNHGLSRQQRSASPVVGDVAEHPVLDLVPLACARREVAHLHGQSDLVSQALQLQHLADEIGLAVQVCHFPPGTSKWNKIEHRMFCHITNNWRGRPLLTRQIVVQLIGSVTTEQGLRVRAELDEKVYEAGVKVRESELTAMAIERDEFHGEWNYVIRPRPRSTA